jgi:hypothetical protein
LGLIAAGPVTTAWAAIIAIAVTIVTHAQHHIEIVLLIWGQPSPAQLQDVKKFGTGHLTIAIIVWALVQIGRVGAW